MASVTVTQEQRTYFNEYIKDGAALHQIAIKHGVSLDAVIRAVRLGGLEPSKAEIGAARLEIIAADGQALARERRAAKAVVPLSAKPAPAPKPTPPKPTPPPAPAPVPKPETEPAVVDPKQIVLETYKLFENINKAAKAAGVSWPTANRIIEAAGLKKPKPVDPPPADSFPVDNESAPEPEPAEDETPELPPTATVSIPVEEVLDQIFRVHTKDNSSQKEPHDMHIPTLAPAVQSAPTYKAVLLPENAVPSLQSGLHLIGELDHLLASLTGKVSHARLDVLLTALHSLADAHHTTAKSARTEVASDV